MDTLFIDSKWEGEVELSNEIINELKGKSSVALFASVQFLNLDKVKKQLNDINIKLLTTKAKRAAVPIQMLGCDVYSDSFEEDIISEADVILYIGDGMFHPNALLLAQMQKKEKKPITIWNPIEKKMKTITIDEIKLVIGKTKTNLMKFIQANTLGILVSTKPGQNFLPKAKALKQLLEKEGKKAYLFIDNTIDLAKLEDYPFIDVWVNTACPRIGMEDMSELPVPVINLKEASDPSKVLENLQ